MLEGTFDLVSDNLSKYKSIYENSVGEGKRRFDLICRLYIAPQQPTYTALSEKYSVDENTIGCDERKALKQLSVMMFGADSINNMSKSGIQMSELKIYTGNIDKSH